MNIKINSLSVVHQVAESFIEMIGNHTIIAFYGAMGVGKTTFIKAICEALGVKDLINSPTFSIVNEYYSKKSSRLIYHFDFYRIDSLAEAMDIGLEEYLYSNALCFIEWPEKIEELLPDNTMRLTITEDSDGGRTIQFE